MENLPGDSDSTHLIHSVLEHIRSNWTVNVHKSGHDDYPRLYLPHSYSVDSPSAPGEGLTYWDVAFTNTGLLLDGHLELARNNVDNLLYLVSRFGFVPQSNSVHRLNRSHPPYLAQMVRDVYRHTRDKEWLLRAIGPLEAEYRFWSTRRSTPTGMSRYLHSASNSDLADFYAKELVPVLGLPRVGALEASSVAYHYMAEDESGHAFTPRFAGRCADFVPVDLNTNLYEYEQLLAFFCREVDQNGEAWEQAAQERITLMRRYLWDGSRGIFTDYDVANDAHSPVMSAASFWPLSVGIAAPEEARATLRWLSEFRRPCGIVTCPRSDSGQDHAWGHGVAWPPVQYAAVQALRRYGRSAEADAIAREFLECVAFRYARTGSLWRGYGAQDGAPYGQKGRSPGMPGWTAGVFRAFAQQVGFA